MRATGSAAWSRSTPSGSARGWGILASARTGRDRTTSRNRPETNGRVVIPVFLFGAEISCRLPIRHRFQHTVHGHDRFARVRRIVRGASERLGEDARLALARHEEHDPPTRGEGGGGHRDPPRVELRHMVGDDPSLAFLQRFGAEMLVETAGDTADVLAEIDGDAAAIQAALREELRHLQGRVNAVQRLSRDVHVRGVIEKLAKVMRADEVNLAAAALLIVNVPSKSS